MKKAAEVLNKQSSFSQWYADAYLESAQLFKKEDEEKSERLELLHQLTGLPTNTGLEMPLQTLLDIGDDVDLLIAGRSIHEVPLGIRLLPMNDAGQLYRTRGKKLKETQDWIRSLPIAYGDYQANLLPHVEAPDFSTIFVVSGDGIKGEAVAGAPHLLTQGFYDEKAPTAFLFDFQQLRLSKEDAAAAAGLSAIFDCLKISDNQLQLLAAELPDVGSFHGYLAGYFETVTSKEYGLWFIDFNRYLGHRLNNIDLAAALNKEQTGSLTGITVSKGQVSGRAVVVDEADIEGIDFRDGDILVCKMTTPLFIPMMKRAGAILTQQGGLLSHAAIISRELKKPCIAGIRNLLDSQIGGRIVFVNADMGNATF